jgi:ABC-type nitrate/sulfonate/bicarbonate transport system substrate-binding protein
VVAVAMLGHEPKDEPGKVLILRKDLIIKSPDDFKGKTYGTRRAGPGDYVFLAEFFKSIGLDPRKDVTILDQIPDNQQIKYLKRNITQGHLYHLHGGIDVEKMGVGYVYRTMDWLNPELSHAVLVFKKDYLKDHPQEVEKIVRAYMKRLKYERTLSQEERINPLGCKDDSEDKPKEWWHKCFGIKVEEPYEGQGYAVYDYPPLVRLDLLEEIQRLLLEYGFIEKKVDLEDFVDNSLVEKIYKELEEK